MELWVKLDLSDSAVGLEHKKLLRLISSSVDLVNQ